MPTKSELREQIEAAGLPQPPSSSSKADLLAVLEQDPDGTVQPPGHPPARSRPAPWVQRSSAIRSED